MAAARTPSRRTRRAMGMIMRGSSGDLRGRTGTGAGPCLAPSFRTATCQDRRIHCSARVHSPDGGPARLLGQVHLVVLELSDVVGRRLEQPVSDVAQRTGRRELLADLRHVGVARTAPGTPVACLLYTSPSPRDGLL